MDIHGATAIWLFVSGCHLLMFSDEIAAEKENPILGGEGPREIKYDLISNE